MCNSLGIMKFSSRQNISRPRLESSEMESVTCQNGYAAAAVFDSGAAANFLPDSPDAPHHSAFRSRDHSRWNVTNQICNKPWNVQLFCN